MISSPDGRGFNDCPPGWEEISEEEFVASKFFIFEASQSELRQIRMAVDTHAPLFDAHMWWFYDGTGVAMHPDRSGGMIRYFKFAVCDHKFGRGTRLANCLMQFTCSKCGFTETIDSSD